jgi:hypothetical protein
MNRILYIAARVVAIGGYIFGRPVTHRDGLIFYQQVGRPNTRPVFEVAIIHGRGRSSYLSYEFFEITTA